jgi:CheY-like chemotaxis protein
MSTALNGKPMQIEDSGFVPTIIIASEARWNNPLARSLQLDGYLVFETSCEVEALAVVISQSRPIDILLADDSMEGHKLATTLKQYRRGMHVLFVSANAQPSCSSGLHPQAALAKIREIIEVPQQITANTKEPKYVYNGLRRVPAPSSPGMQFNGSSAPEIWGEQQRFRTPAGKAAIARGA